MSSPTSIPLPPVPRVPHHLLSPMVSTYMYTDVPARTKSGRTNSPNDIDSHHGFSTLNGHTAEKSGYNSTVPTPIKLQVGNLIDMKLQDIILEYPIIRAILVPDCDLDARGECVKLLGRIVAAAGMAYQFELTQKKQSGDLDSASHNNDYDHSDDDDDHLHSNLENDHILRGIYSNLPRQRAGISNADDQNFSQAAITYANLSYTLHILSAMHQRMSTVSWVFWEFWDSIFLSLSSVVGEDVVAQASAGRLFKETGHAATYKFKKMRQSKPRSPVSVNSDNADKQSNDGSVEGFGDISANKLTTVSLMKRYGLIWGGNPEFNVENSPKESSLDNSNNNSSSKNKVPLAKDQASTKNNKTFEDKFKSAFNQIPELSSPQEPVSYDANTSYKGRHNDIRERINNEKSSASAPFPLIHQEDADVLMMSILNDPFASSTDLMGMHKKNSGNNNNNIHSFHSQNNSISPVADNQAFNTAATSYASLGEKSFMNSLNQSVDSTPSVFDLRRKILMLEEENTNLKTNLNHPPQSIHQSDQRFKRSVDNDTSPAINSVNMAKKPRVEGETLSESQSQVHQTSPVETKINQLSANKSSFGSKKDEKSSDDEIAKSGGDDNGDGDSDSMLVLTVKPKSRTSLQSV